MNRLRRLARRLGLDSAIIFFFMARIFTIVATPVVLFLITVQLTAEQQGYYFAFSSLVALSMFFELGLGVVLTYFASHEYVNLRWDDNGRLTGDTHSLSRLASMLQQSLKWYGIICSFFAVFVLPLGFYILAQRNGVGQVHYVLPWILTVVLFALGTMIIPITSLLDGCGQISRTLQMRLIQAICSPLAVALTLIFGGQLYAVPVETAAALTVFGIWLLRRYPRVILQLLALPTDPKQPAISWRHEILPMQMRVALFVMSAYFQSYVIVPLLFRFRGPAEAGQMGMSLRLTNSIYAVSVGWINVRAPKMGTLIGGNDMAGARQTAFTAIMRGVLTSGLGIAALFVVIVVAQHYYPAFPTRLLPLTPTMVIAFTVPVSVLLAGLSAYLRSYKIEPFGFPGVLTASINVVICTISAYYGSASVLAYAYAGQILFITLPYYIWIFLRRQREGEAGIRAKLAQAAQPVAGSP